MRNLIFVLVAFLLVSCKGKTIYQSRILIKNEFDRNIDIRLYPKAAYLSGDTYSATDNGSEKRSVTMKLSEGVEMSLFTTQKIDIQAEVLLSEIFDSIHLSPSDAPWRLVKFSQDSVSGYRFNMFVGGSNWVSETRHLETQTTLKRSPVESYDYAFRILETDFEN